MDDPLKNIRELNKHRLEQAKGVEQEARQFDNAISLEETVVKSFQALVNYLDNKVSKTVVINQLEEIGTPDALKVVGAVESLHETLKTHENVDLSGLIEILQEVLVEAKKIPKETPKINIPKPIDNAKQLQAVEKAVKSLEKVVKAKKLVAEAPIVNVPETQVNVEKPDLSPIQKELKAVLEAVKAIVIPEPVFDTKPVEKELKKLQKLFDEFLDSVPTGGGSGGSSWTAVNSSGTPVPIQLDSDGKVPVIDNFQPTVDYDYLDVQQTDADTETYVFKDGGSGGTTVRTVVINYVDSTKEDIDNVSWS